MTGSSSQPHSHSPQSVADLGEEQVIQHFAGSVLPEGSIGIGDDCAVTDGAGGQKRLAGTDLLVEDIHFRAADINPKDLGHKALAVNLSDIAAMGGTPDGFLLSLALPGSLPVRWLDDFRDGLMELAGKHETPLLGGDTTRSPGNIVISIMIMGYTAAQHLKLRSEAQPGDKLCVTGPLGDSVAGLSILSNPGEHDDLSDSHRRNLIRWHCRPEPAVSRGRWLGEQPDVHAMIDLSDGLLRDARRLADQSSSCITISLDRLPLSLAFEAFCKRERSPEQAQELAAAGGEDYHLLLTVAGERCSRVTRRFERRFGTPLHVIGTVEAGLPEACMLRDGTPAEVRQQEYKHFNRP